MDWMRIEAGFARHPKIIAAGPRLALAQLRVMGWSAEHETGGHIPVSALSVIPLTRREASQLVECRLLDVNGDGWHIHDWDVYQPTDEEMAEDREVRERRRVAAREKKARQRARARGDIE